jgi:hypothetical protein
MTMQSHTWEFEPRRVSGAGKKECDEWCAPLHIVERLVAERDFGHLHAHNFRVDDFQIGPRLVRPNRPNLHLYKHGYTRSYLNVDTTGRVYRFVPPKNSISGSFGKYVLHRSLAIAIEDLLLWELDGVARPGELRLVPPLDWNEQVDGVGPAA